MKMRFAKAVAFSCLSVCYEDLLTKSAKNLNFCLPRLYIHSVGRAQLHGNYSVTTRVWKR